MLKLASRAAWGRFARNPISALVKGKDKILAQFAASFLRGYSPFPRNLTFFLTYRCNLRCNVCGQWGITGYAKNFPSEELRNEVDISTLKKVIEEITPQGPEITMCGGEVFLYEDWFAFMSHVKSKGLTCNLTTNGTMLERNVERLVEVGLDKISISLDGPELIHNKARNARNGFHQVVRGIQLLHEIKEKRDKELPVVELACTISDQNFRNLDEMVEIAESLRANCLIFLHLFNLNEMEFSAQSKLFHKLFQTDSVHWSGYRYSPDGLDVDYLAKKLDEIKGYKRKFHIIVYPDFSQEEIKRYYSQHVFLANSYKNLCLAPWMSVYVLPNGDISPCSSFVAGNIRHESLLEIWNNKRFRHFRRVLRKRKAFPACSKCCEFYKY